MCLILMFPLRIIVIGKQNDCVKVKKKTFRLCQCKIKVVEVESRFLLPISPPPTPEKKLLQGASSEKNSCGSSRREKSPTTPHHSRHVSYVPSLITIFVLRPSDNDTIKFKVVKRQTKKEQQATFFLSLTYNIIFSPDIQNDFTSNHTTMCLLSYCVRINSTHQCSRHC